MLKLGSDFGTRFERSDIRTPNDIPNYPNIMTLAEAVLEIFCSQATIGL